MEMIGKTSVNQPQLLKLASRGEWACPGPVGLWLWPWFETGFAIGGWGWLAMAEEVGS